jgi:hypothetical protein
MKKGIMAPKKPYSQSLLYTLLKQKRGETRHVIWEKAGEDFFFCLCINLYFQAQTGEEKRIYRVKIGEK